MTMKYEPVIGLEVHVQVKTNTKLFCSCSTNFGDRQNTNICPVCTGQPGALPVLNKFVVTQAIKAALATNCKINKKNIFARKNYFYPDLPKGYQISQFEQPFCENGFIEIFLEDGVKKKIRLNRIHIEEDAGKNVHQGADGILGSDYSQVDLNRACTPLLEVVSEPDISSAAEANEYLNSLKLIMQYAGVSDADMEKGQLRVDVNVSVKPKGSDKLGTRAEIKNMNSFRGVVRAISYEIERQIDILDSGGKVLQETRNYDDNTGITTSLRSKEESHDYRYFPEPDLLPLIISDDWIAEVKANMPELPFVRKKKYVSEFGLSDYDANILVNNKIVSDFFEKAVVVCKEPKLASNWLTSEIAGYLKEKDLTLPATKLTPQNLGEMILLIKKGTISNKIAKELLSKLMEKNISPRSLVEKLGVAQIANQEDLLPIIKKIIDMYPEQVKKYKSGESKLLSFFIGQAMKETKGRANPQLLSELFRKNMLQ